MTETKKSEWNSNIAFVMAMIGSAVGLGNIWRFPNVLYSNGVLAGGGRPLFALSSKLSFKGSDLDIYPEIAKLWKDGIKQLAQYGITESEVENLLSGSVFISLPFFFSEFFFRNILNIFTPLMKANVPQFVSNIEMDSRSRRLVVGICN